MASVNKNNAIAAAMGGLTPSSSGMYSLKWNSFQNHLATGVKNLLDNDEYTDVTLACDGQFIRAHRFLLSVCSPFFKKLFQANTSGKGNENTIVILNNVRFKDLENVIKFIYNGQANVANADLRSFLHTGELLQILGLSSGEKLNESSSKVDNKISDIVPASVTEKDTSRIRPADTSNKSSAPPSKTPRLIQPRSQKTPPLSVVVSNNDNNVDRHDGGEIEEVDPLELNDSERKGLNNGSINDLRDSLGMDSCDNQPHMYARRVSVDGLVYQDSDNEDTDNFDEYFDDQDDMLEQEMSYDNEESQAQMNIATGSSSRSGKKNLTVTPKRKGGAVKRKGKKQRNKYKRCTYCNADIYRSNISRHMATLHANLLLADGKRLFRCSICKTTYRTLGHLQLHMQRHTAEEFEGAHSVHGNPI